MSFLALDRVSKSFGAVAAVRDFSAAVGRGEGLGLVGPSGCGKTTVLRLIAGLERPDAGAIAFDGERVCGNGEFVAARDRGVGMVFQELALWPHMTVERQVDFVLKECVRNPRERRAAVEELITRVELGDRRRHRPADLSGGEAQRVALIRALASRPRVLLLDEPFSHLDGALRERMVGWLRELKAGGLTMVLASHDAGDHAGLCERVVVMERWPYATVGAEGLEHRGGAEGAEGDVRERE